MERALEMTWGDLELSLKLQILISEPQLPSVKGEWYANTCLTLANGLKNKYCASLSISTPWLRRWVLQMRKLDEKR